MRSVEDKKNKYCWVYILECENGSLYTGSTGNLVKRYYEHLTGKAAKYTRAFKPVKVAQCWQVFGEKGMALRVEHLIKGFDRKAKELQVNNPHGLVKIVSNKFDGKIDIMVFDQELVNEKIQELGDNALKIMDDPFPGYVD